MENNAYQQPLRSYVLRSNRLTKGQKRGFDTYWEKYGLLYQEKHLHFPGVFENTNPVLLEIGFGNGEILTNLAKQNPHKNYLGIEVHQPGIGHVLIQLAEQNSCNVRIIQHDAVEVLREMVPNAALSGVYLFFPDPWHKRRHHKRRIVQPNFIALLANKLHANGFLHIATDWENYAKHILATVSHAKSLFHQMPPNETLTLQKEQRPSTRFERRGNRLGHKTWDFIFTRY